MSYQLSESNLLDSENLKRCGFVEAGFKRNNLEEFWCGTPIYGRVAQNFGVQLLLSVRQRNEA